MGNYTANLRMPVASYRTIVIGLMPSYEVVSPEGGHKKV